MGYQFKQADIEPLLLSTLQMVFDRMHVSPPRNGGPTRRSPAIVDLISRMQSLARPPVEASETMLRVGSLELDLVDRTARRGDRPINLLPREFQLLRYMMRRSNQLLTRAVLFKEVWHYKFVPESNLVDVHIGRLRRKVDAPDEAPMIRTVRGVGYQMQARNSQGGNAA